MLDTILSEFPKYFPEVNNMLAAGLPVWARVLGLMRGAPFLNRTEVPMPVRAGFAFLFAVIVTGFIKPEPASISTPLAYSIAVNFLCGALIGFIVNCIVKAVEAGGDMINMQQGLSSATIMDPSSNAQVSIMGKLFGVLGLVIFIETGGMYWTFNAFVRSFDIFPVSGVFVPLDEFINMPYLVKITSNVLYTGLQIASPVLMATLGQDIILGIISKTAPQVNVFSLSFLFKPGMGAIILIFIMPSVFEVINDFFLSFSNIF